MQTSDGETNNNKSPLLWWIPSDVRKYITLDAQVEHAMGVFYNLELHYLDFFFMHSIAFMS